MKKVYIHAYMANNLGDDLMVRILCRRYPKVKFLLIADEKYKKIFGDIDNLEVFTAQDKKVIRWDHFWKKVKHTDDGFRKMLIKTSDAVIHIGGSAFVQHFDDYSAFYNTDATLRRLSKRMYLVGANFGPYTDENYYKQYYNLFEQYDGVTFRDAYSHRLFSSLPNVRCAPDVVFNYRPDKVTDSVRVQKQVLFSVIRMDWRGGKYAINQYEEPYKEFMVKLAKTYLSRGYKVLFVSFCEGQGDLQAIQEICTNLSEEDRKHTTIYSYGDHIEECVALFDESEVIVGTRFHSIILGWLKNKKVLPIVYDNKTRNILKDEKYQVYLEMDGILEE